MLHSDLHAYRTEVYRAFCCSGQLTTTYIRQHAGEYIIFMKEDPPPIVPIPILTPCTVWGCSKLSALIFFWLMTSERVERFVVILKLLFCLGIFCLDPSPRNALSIVRTDLFTWKNQSVGYYLSSRKYYVWVDILLIV